MGCGSVLLWPNLLLPALKLENSAHRDALEVVWLLYYDQKC